MRWLVSLVLFSLASLNFAVPSTNSKYIFVTQTEYEGNLGGIKGADAICQKQAYKAGSLLPKGLNFKALLISSNRYPCDASGSCGGKNSLDWPLKANDKYYYPNNKFFNTVNSYNVFDGSVIFLMQANGKIVSSQAFWMGIQNILRNIKARDIVAWAYANVNPSNASKQYKSNLATCKDWTSKSNNYEGSIGQAGLVKGVSGEIANNTWGDYYYFSDDEKSYLFNMWSASDNNACNGKLPIVCVS